MGTADEHLEMAGECLKQTETLAGKPTMTDEEFLKSMSGLDALVDHDVDPETCVCGHCFHQFVMAQTARDMLAAGDTEDGIRRWSDEAQNRWRQSKFFLLWREEEAAGRDPHAAFAERGWET